ncbi:hypothetical protein J6590_008675 [Homalodisca vitripennis]|nr:hypothetical protein J6590_008675 [Homalodisca vitripennis]
MQDIHGVSLLQQRVMVIASMPRDPNDITSTVYFSPLMDGVSNHRNAQGPYRLPFTCDGFLLSTELQGWNMREVSLIHQGVLVIAEVAWDPPAAVPAVYLVTWELAGGGLKGNLLTDSTCVTLSLWPDTVYRIQVQLVREPQTLSEVLVLDTRQAAPLLSPAPTAAPTTPGYGHPGFEGVAGAASALLVFFAVALVFSTRRRSSLPEKPLEVEELHSSNHFKLFPPPVRLLVEPTSLPVLYPVGADSQEELTLSRSDPTV